MREKLDQNSTMIKSEGIDNSAPVVAESLGSIASQVDSFNAKATAMLTGATSNMASQLKPAE